VAEVLEAVSVKNEKPIIWNWAQANEMSFQMLSYALQMMSQT
jgi:hypothetical protein